MRWMVYLERSDWLFKKKLGVCFADGLGLVSNNAMPLPERLNSILTTSSQCSDPSMHTSCMTVPSSSTV
jgi:hypothetical protein